MKKSYFVIGGIAVIIAGLVVLYPFANQAWKDWMLSVPKTDFDHTPVPLAPDYSQEKYWAALPNKKDGADWVPVGSGFTDEQANAPVDVFFIYPTAAFYGSYWVAGFDNWLHIAAVDYGILPQQASPFNATGKIYAPRYRSIRMGIWMAKDKDSMNKAIDFAYQDVKKSFEYYLEHYNRDASGKRRPFIIASHSQGTTHAIRLIREMIDGKEISNQFIAGYLVGNTDAMPWFEHIPVCSSAEQTGCYVTWNTMLEGGDTYHWIAEKGLSKIDCVNPLSWKADTATADKSQNNGSLPMVDYNVMFNRLPALQKNVVGVHCGAEGMLWMTNTPEQPGYTTALFPGGSYHTYDINFFYDSIRNNAKLRAKTFLAQPAKAE